MLQSGKAVTAVQIGAAHFKCCKIETFKSWRFETKILVVQDETEVFFFLILKSSCKC